MLSIRWLTSGDGIDYSKRLPLPDDKPEVVRRLCRLLHNRRDPYADDLRGVMHPSPKAISQCAQRLLDLAELADMLDCLASVELTADAILAALQAHSMRPDMQPLTLIRLMGVAYLFKQQRHFTIFTQRMVLDHYDDPTSNLLSL